MASALELYKLLPKTNCGECGIPTCLAFAMKLASKTVKAVDCPHLCNEVKNQLDEASLPAITQIKFGSSTDRLVIGGELVFFRHEKKFNNQTVLCIAIKDTDDISIVESKLQEQSIERLAEKLTTNMIALINESNKKAPFFDLIERYKKVSTNPLLLYSDNSEILRESLDLIGKNNRVLIGPVTNENKIELFSLAKSSNCVLVLSSENGILGLSKLITEARDQGFEDFVLDCSCETYEDTLRNQIVIRWEAVKEKNMLLGYPIISFPFKYSNENFSQEILIASLFITKFSSIIALSSSNLNQIIPLLVLRQNIYTDPQKPIQVAARLYEFGQVSEDSPVFLTTNFSLTYFTVSTDIESTNIPSYLLVVDTEGTSVLTAYAADKINEKIIAKAIDNSNLSKKINHKTIIIPGYLSPLSGKIEETTGWDILVGPTDSAQIPLFLKKNWRSVNG